MKEETIKMESIEDEEWKKHSWWRLTCSFLRLLNMVWV